MIFKKKEFFLLIFLIFLQSCSGGRIGNFLESSFNDLEKTSKNQDLQNNLLNKKDINLEKENKKFDDKKNKKIKKVEDLKNVPEKIDIVDVFRPSKETPGIAQQAKEIGSKVLWLQYGIHSDEAKAIAESSNMEFISNRCIKQEYQKIFQKSNPVFPALKN